MSFVMLGSSKNSHNGKKEKNGGNARKKHSAWGRNGKTEVKTERH